LNDPGWPPLSPKNHTAEAAGAKERREKGQEKTRGCRAPALQVRMTIGLYYMPRRGGSKLPKLPCFTRCVPAVVSRADWLPSVAEDMARLPGIRGNSRPENTRFLGRAIIARKSRFPREVSKGIDRLSSACNRSRHLIHYRWSISVGLEWSFAATIDKERNQ